MALQSPFASADVQIGNVQSEVVEHVRNRKRARCPSADIDSCPLSKIPQHSNRQLDASAATSPDQGQVTLHRPTPHRPTASTPCCFEVPSATHPLQLRPSSLLTARPTAPIAVPSSLATAAALASANAAAKSSGSNPSDDDRASPTQAVRSQECKLFQGTRQSAFLLHWLAVRTEGIYCALFGSKL